MSLNRTPVSVGSGSTIINKTWENEFKNKINNIIDNVSTFPMGSNHIYNLQLAYVSASTISVAAGICMDDTNTILMKLSSSSNIVLSSSGAGGLDTGSEAANTWYYVFVIKNTSGTVSVIASASYNNPTLPSGYIYKRLVGAIRNDGSSNIILFYTHGSGSIREFIYDDLQTVLSAGTASSFTNIDIISFIPHLITKLGIYIAYIYATAGPAGGVVCDLQITNSNFSGTSSAGYIFVSARSDSHGTSGDNDMYGIVPCNNLGKIQYKIVESASGSSPNANIYSAGFRLEL